MIRSSRSQMFFKIGVLKTAANFTGKHLCWSLFFNKVAGLGSAEELVRIKFIQINFSDFLKQAVILAMFL